MSKHHTDPEPRTLEEAIAAGLHDWSLQFETQVPELQQRTAVAYIENRVRVFLLSRFNFTYMQIMNNIGGRPVSDILLELAKRVGAENAA